MSRPPKTAATSAGQARISVQVTPRASTNSIEALDDGAIRVRVTAAPVDGAANDAIVALLADRLGLAAGRLQIVSGATARRKIVGVSGLTSDEVQARLREIGSQPSVARRRSTAGRMPPAR